MCNLFDSVSTFAFFIMNSTDSSSSAPLSLPSFEVKREVEHVEQMDQMGEMEQVDEEKEVHKVDQVHQEDQETLSFPSVTADVGNQVSLGALLHVFVCTTNLQSPEFPLLCSISLCKKHALCFFKLYHRFCCTGFSDAAENPMGCSQQGDWRFSKTKSCSPVNVKYAKTLCA